VIGESSPATGGPHGASLPHFMDARPARTLRRAGNFFADADAGGAAPETGAAPPLTAARCWPFAQLTVYLYGTAASSFADGAVTPKSLKL
jgi:hypothetical protein